MLSKTTFLFYSLFVLSIACYAGQSRPNCGSKTIKIIGKDTITTEVECGRKGGWTILTRKNNVLDGPCESFYPNGNHSQKVFHKNGKEDGIKRRFLIDGFVATYRVFNNGIPIDTHRVFYDNKSPKSFDVYDSSGYQIGWCKKWYEATGILSDSTFYSHGDKLQEFLFYPSGKPMFSSTLKADGYIISSIAFYPNGKKSGEVKNGNGRVIIPRHADRTDFFDTLTIVNGKVQNAEHEFFKDR